MNLSIVTSYPACPVGSPVALLDGAELIGCYASVADAAKSRALHEESDVVSIERDDDTDIDELEDEIGMPDDDIDLDGIEELDERTYRAIAAEMDRAALDWDLDAG